jgi:hypothetical protein
MPRRPPDEVGARVIDAAQEQDTYDGSPEEVALFYAVKNPAATPLLVDVYEALCIYDDDEYRHTLNALILGKASDREISTGIGVPATVLPSYRRLFFDRSVFRHDLEIHRYVNELAVDDDIKEIYRKATQQGPGTVIAKMIVGERPDLDPVVSSKVIHADMHARFLEHRGQKLGSEIARLALALAPTVLRAAAIVKGFNQGGGSGDDLKSALELETVDNTDTPDELGIELKDIMS